MKYLFVFFICIAEFNFCNGQNEYIPYVKENSFCLNYYFFNTEPYPKPSGATLSYFIGDSIYNAKLYRKRYTSSLSGTHPCPLEQRPCFIVDEPYKPIDKIFDGLYRDDSIQRKVFCIPIGSLEEVELYNFALSISDTISYLLRSKMPEEYDGEGIIDSISYDNIYGKVRKVLFFQAKSQYFPFNAFFIEVIEGIGLKCDYCEGTLPDCNIISSTKEQVSSLQMTLSPNPVRDILNIETEIAVLNTAIIDQNGRIVMTTREKEINVSDLSSGIYFLKCFGVNNMTYFSKFVKM